MPRAFALTVVVLVLCATGVLAQNHVAFSSSPQAARPSGHNSFVAPNARLSSSFGLSGRGMRHRRQFAGSPFFYGAPYFYSDYYEPYEQEYPAPEPPPQPAPVQVKNEPLPDPVLLELRSGQWVRVTNFGETSERALSAGAQGSPSTAKPQEMAPAILVYRDGHIEEVSSYSIIGRMIYTKADYWTAGAWTRTIQIADLDIPATIKQNQLRGVKFELPSGPDEVMIRP